MRQHTKKKNTALYLSIAVFGAVLLLAALFLLMPKGDAEAATPVLLPKTIPKNVTVGGVSVGKLSRDAAIAAVRQVYPDACREQDMVLAFPNRKHRLSPVDTGAHWAVEEAVESALTAPAGEAVELEFAVDTGYIQSRMEAVLDALGGVYIPCGVRFLGDIPDPTQEDGQVQTLQILRGQPGLNFNMDKLLSDVLEAYRAGVFQVSVDDLGTIQEPQAIDLAAALESIYLAPQEPVLNRETGEVTPGQRGYGFDLEEAQAALDALQFGETAELPCQFLSPEHADEDVWFQDVLGVCRTPHTDNENRNENLRLACAALDGKILQPGEVLSYNDTLGKRTADRGYMPAPAYSGTELVDEIGGGICQVSSTLYLSSLLAELKIVARQNHGFPVDYIPIGLDATVNWGTTDLKIKNGYDFPIKIAAQVTDTHVIVQILGMETRDYYVRIEHRVEGPRYASAYLCHFDRETQKEISRTLDHASLYLDVVWQWPDYADNDRIVTYR